MNIKKSAVRRNSFYKRPGPVFKKWLLFSTFFLIFVLSLLTRLSPIHASGFRVARPDAISHLKHSMADPFKYASSKLPQNIKSLIAGRKINSIIVFQGGLDACAQYFKSRFPAVVLEEFADHYADGSKTYLFKSSGGGFYIDYRNYGRDMAVHKAMLYHYAGLPHDKITVITGGSEENSVFASAVAAAGPADFAIIGYVRSFVRDFTLRKLAFERAKFLKEFLKDSAARDKLMRSLKAAFILKYGIAGLKDEKYKAVKDFFRLASVSDPSLFFKKSPYYFALDDAQDSLLKICAASGGGFESWPASGFKEILVEKGFKYNPVGDGYSFKAGEYLKSAFDIRRFDFIVKSGSRARILITKHPYGEQAGILAGELLASGVSRVLFLGSCGGLDENMAAGDIVVPEAFYRFDENARFYGPAFSNHIYRYFNDKIRSETGEVENSLKLRNYHVSLPSPLIETAQALEKFKSKKITSVDCESYYLFEKKNSGRLVSAFFIVTDLPGKPNTLESFDSGSAVITSAQMRALDFIIEYFEIEDAVVY